MERTIGLFKKRFSILMRKMCYDAEFYGNVIVACAVLHNYLLYQEHDVANEVGNLVVEEDMNEDVNQNANGLAYREDFINRNFV